MFLNNKEINDFQYKTVSEINPRGPQGKDRLGYCFKPYQRPPLGPGGLSGECVLRIPMRLVIALRRISDYGYITGTLKSPFTTRLGYGGRILD